MRVNCQDRLTHEAEQLDNGLEQNSIGQTKSCLLLSQATSINQSINRFRQPTVMNLNDDWQVEVFAASSNFCVFLWLSTPTKIIRCRQPSNHHRIVTRDLHTTHNVSNSQLAPNCVSLGCCRWLQGDGNYFIIIIISVAINKWGNMLNETSTSMRRRRRNSSHFASAQVKVDLDSVVSLNPFSPILCRVLSRANWLRNSTCCCCSL